ncbi:MAG TPA: molybdopterin converting factor subunit 1 [Parvibaculum sp.]|uniref:molybdopterin converting factor subunit 1 n=1 Tax=Parvibaculum sp. TaxID=2024848 RepID=UPI002CE8C128|nr:molybdopterin converting factor subunit 1 [Parvibaculum sp.]HMM14542.1 molybdopterin converting factor subunit 1 [Parvibaculum sp.]
MKILYFAWVRQKVGTPEEEIALPDGLGDVAALIDWLKTRGPGYEAAFENLDLIRVAVDQAHVDFDASIERAEEIAFFPPVTGG